MVPALLAPLTRGAASLVGFAGAKRALKGIVPKAKSLVDDAAKWIKGNPATAGKGIVGTVTGSAIYKSISDALSALGINDDQFQLIITGVGLLGVIAAVGSLFNINIGGDQ